MPSIRESQRVDRSRLGGAGHLRHHNGKNPTGPDVHPGPELAPPDLHKFPQPAPPQELGGSSPNMSSSLPPIAASYDQFVRQFYRSGLPLQRIFLVGLE